jgi:RHS repeat-associated protein
MRRMLLRVGFASVVSLSLFVGNALGATGIPLVAERAAAQTPPRSPAAAPTSTPATSPTPAAVPSPTPAHSGPSGGAETGSPGGGTAVPTETPSPVPPLPPLAAASDATGVAAVATIDQAGGRISSPDGRVVIDFPRGAVGEALSVQIKRRDTRSVTSPSPDREIVGYWDFSASSVARGANVHTFGRNLTVTLRFSPDELRGLDPAALTYWSIDTATGKWTSVAGHVDPQSRTIAVNVNHFSGGAATDQKIVDTAPLIDGHNVNLQTGAASINVPIAVPQGRNGLAPQLSLNYDSTRVEAMHQYSSLSGWTGMGWDLGTGSVQMSADASGTRYFLAGGGAGGEMMQDPAVDEGATYRLRDEQYTRVQSDCGVVAFGTDSSPRQISVETSPGVWGPAESVSGITSSDPRVHPLDDTAWFATNDVYSAGNAWGWGTGSRSTDGGKTWSSTPDPGIGGGGIADIAEDAGGRIWATADTTDQWSPQTKVYYSDDGGSTWTLSTTLGPGPSQYRSVSGWKVLTSPTDPNTVAVVGFSHNIPNYGDYRGFVLYTHDRGATWNVNYNAATSQGGATRMYYDAALTSSGRIVALGPFKIQSPWHWYVAYSDDFGATWTTSVDIAGTLNAVNGLFVDPSGQRLGFIATTYISGGNFTHRLMLSTDSGATFSQVSLGQELDQYLGGMGTFGTFAASPQTDSLYVYTGTVLNKVLRLSPVSAAGQWLDVTGNYPFTNAGYDGLAVPKTAQCQFEATGKNGTSYVYGANDASRRWYVEYDGSHWVRRYYQFDLSYATDVMGNRVDYTYWQQLLADSSCGSAPQCQYVMAAYPEDIYYNYSGTQPQADVHFDLTHDNDNGQLGRTPAVLVRNDDPYDVTCGGGTYTAPKVMEIRNLSSVKASVYSGGAWKLVRQYDFDITAGDFQTTGCNPPQPWSGTNLLNSVTVRGSDGTSALSVMGFQYTQAGDAACLPVLGLPYGCHDAYRDGSSGSDGYGSGHDVWGYDWPHLKQATNGFGGTTSFQYRLEDNGCTCLHWTHSAVTQTTSDGGMGQPSVVTAYSYTGPYEWDYPNPLDPTTNDSFNSENLGYATATETDASGNSTIHSYYVGANWDDEIRRGREYDTLLKDSEGNRWKETSTTWAIRGVARLNGGAYYVNFVAPAQTDTYLRDGTHLVVKTVYDGDTNGTACPAGNTTCFGLQTSVDDLGDVDAGGNSRGARVVTNTSYNVYVPAWVFTPQHVDKIDPAHGNALLSSTSYYYDGATTRTPSVAPAKGLLTATSTQIDTTSYTNTFDVYDSYGNRLKESLATSTRPENTSCSNSLGCIPSGVGATTTAYDSTYHVFPVSVTDAASRQTSYDYTDATNGDFVMGKATKVTEPTGHVSQLALDIFGRTTESWDNLDTQSLPTVQYAYTWGSERANPTDPNRTLVENRTASGTTNVHESLSCMDGFGREVLSSDQYDGTSANEVRTDYDARGMKAAASAPAYWTSSISACPATLDDITTLDRSALTYNPLGDVSTTTTLAANASTGPRTQVIENGVTTSSVDENFKSTVSTRDIGNKTLTVTEPLISTVERPSGQGAYAAWDASPATNPSSSHYLNLDGTSSDDGQTQINSATANAIDTQTFAGPGLPGGTTVSSVVLHFRWKQDDAGTPNPAEGMLTVFRQSGSDIQGPEYHKTNSDGWGDDSWSMSTNPRTGVAWTLAEVNAGLEFGFKVSSATGSHPYVSQAWIEVVTQSTATNSTIYQDDALGRLTGVTDAAGHHTTLSYDMTGRKVGMTDPDMGAWGYGYDAAGNLISQTDANNNHTTLSYDALNRLTLRWSPDQRAYFIYDNYSAIDSNFCPNQTDPSTGALVNPSTAIGRLVGSVIWLGLRPLDESCYDLRGNQIVSRTDPDAAHVLDIHRTFDALGRATSVTYPDNETVAYQEDTQGDVTGLNSNTNNVAIYSAATLTPWGAPSSVTLGNTGSTFPTNYTYDYRERVTNISTGTGGQAQNLVLTYDDASNVTASIDKVTPESAMYTYDQLNRLTSMTLNGAPTPSASYGYDALGDLTSKVEGTSSLTLAYASPGHTHAVSSTSGSLVQTLAYDADGNMTGASYAGQAYTYSAQNQLTRRTNADGSATSYIYDANGALAKRTTTGPAQMVTLRPNGQGSYATWNTSPATNPSTAHYQNVREAAPDNDATQINSQIWGNIDSHTYPGANVPADAVIDQVALKFVWKHWDNFTPDPGTDMQLLFRQSGTDTYGPTYDSTNAAGWVSNEWDMTTNPRTGVAWSLGDVNGSLEFGFVPYSVGGSWPYITQAYVVVTYHTVDYTLYAGGVYEQQQDGSITKYYAGPSGIVAIRQVPSGGGAGTIYYPLHDQLGSTVGMTNATGTVIATMKYWPYGATRATTGTLPTDKQYTGQQIENGDADLGLYNYKARFYSTTLGRFVSADTLTPETKPRALDRYAYVYDNPLRFMDLTGHCVFGLKCSPTIAANLAACAQSVEGCAAVFNALGLQYTVDLLEAVHEFAAIGVNTVEYWRNFFKPENNPYLNRGALIAGYGGHSPLQDPESTVLHVESYLNWEYDKYFPNTISSVVQADINVFQRVFSLDCSGVHDCSELALNAAAIAAGVTFLATGDPAFAAVGLYLTGSGAIVAFNDYRYGRITRDQFYTTLIESAPDAAPDSDPRWVKDVADLAISVADYVKNRLDESGN